MTTKYFAILTSQGAARLANATALGTKLNITQMAVGDGNGTLPTPDAAQTKLINQRRIAPLNMLSVDPANASQIIAEQVIPENEGGFWIREIGLYDDAGVLIAVANCPETYKPQLQEGSGRTQTIRMILIVSGTSSITLKIDPSVVLSTRQYVDDRVIEVKAYADTVMKNHLSSAHPHDQYLQISNALKELVSANLVDDVLKNLGLSDSDGLVGRLISRKTYLSSCVYVPSNSFVRNVRIRAQAPGGGSAGVPATSSSQTGGCQPGYYGQFIDVTIPVTLVTGQSITIGAPGTAGTGTSLGTSGGNITIGTLVTLQGGSAGALGAVGSGALIIGAAYELTGKTCSSTIKPNNSSNGVTQASQMIQGTAGAATGFIPSQPPLEGGFYGKGGNGVYSGASTAAVVGNPGRPGIVIIEELA